MKKFSEQNRFFKKEPGQEMPEKIEIAIDGKKINDIETIDFEDILGDKGACKFVLRYGKKEQELFIEDVYGGKIVAYDGIENIGKKEESEKDETTKLYERVKAILQEAANQINLPIYYSLNAHFILPDGKANPIIKWAGSEKGKAVFDWISTRIDESNGCAYFQKVFHPEEGK